MLRSVEVPIQDITECIKEYRKINETDADGNSAPIPIIEENICSGKLGKDSCEV